MRRDPDDPDAPAYWLAYGPAETTIEQLVRVCPLGSFRAGEGENGMDHYEVRTWEACHRFITLCLLAHALLVVLRAQARFDESGDGKKGMANPG